MCIKCTNTFTFAENKPIFSGLNADEVNAGNIEATEVESLLYGVQKECECTSVYRMKCNNAS